MQVIPGSSSRVISGFPGIGKSFYCYAHRDTLGHAHDSDSSLFSWFSEKGVRQGRNTSFPANYVEYVHACFGVYTNIFVSTHAEVRAAMKEAGLLHYIVYPTRDQKEIYLKRYIERDSHEYLIELIDQSWDTWLDELESETNVNHIVLKRNQFLSDVL